MNMKYSEDLLNKMLDCIGLAVYARNTMEDSIDCIPYADMALVKKRQDIYANISNEQLWSSVVIH